MARRRASKDHPFAHRNKVEFSRLLRRSMTPAERLLWQALRGDMLGVRARSQHIICGWIVDFYLPAARLVIEVDGDIHDLAPADDERRSEVLRGEGLEVLRFRNEAIVADVGAVVLRIAEALRAAVATRGR